MQQLRILRLHLIKLDREADMTHRSLHGILLCLLIVPTALSIPVIGIFSDENVFSDCDEYVTLYSPLTVYVMAYWAPGEVPDGARAAEFKIHNFPTDDGFPLGDVQVIDTTEVVLGDIWTTYSAAWAWPQGSDTGYFTICIIELTAYDSYWISDDHITSIVAGDYEWTPVLVDGNFEQVEALGGMFTFNCISNSCECDPTPVESSTWSSLKTLF